MKKRIVFAVTNDLSYDQRMQRICSSLFSQGYQVLLVGRKRKHSLLLKEEGFSQKRLRCLFDKGLLFYAEYNLRLLFFLLFVPTDAFCAIDIDTILPCWIASVVRRKKRVYDAHELFTEQKEIVTRKKVQRFWLFIERFCVPRFEHGYTVNYFIKEELGRRYGVNYGIIRNLPRYNATIPAIQQPPFIIYQGAVNEGRSFETLIPAMQKVNATLVICGEGNYYEQTKALVKQYALTDKVKLKGYVMPTDLRQLTPQAIFGITLFEATGLNQYYSLSNRFFDYMMAGIPQVCVNYPEYAMINNEFEIALLIEDTAVQTIADALNLLLEDAALYNKLQQNAIKARNTLNWEQEGMILNAFWQKIL